MLTALHNFSHVFFGGIQSAAVISPDSVKALGVTGDIIFLLATGKRHKESAVTYNRQTFTAYTAKGICKYNGIKADILTDFPLKPLEVL